MLALSASKQVNPPAGSDAKKRIPRSAIFNPGLVNDVKRDSGQVGWYVSIV